MLFRLMRQPKGAIGTVIVTFYLLLVIFGPILAPHDPLKQDFAATLRFPSSAHWFGTDQLGRDIFSRILAAAPVSLGIGIGGVALAFAVGVPLGLAAAWRRGPFDAAIMRGVDVMLSFPDIVLALAIVAILGPSTQNVVIAVGIVAIPVFVRTTRAVALSTIAEPFVDGAMALGCAPSRVVLRHVLPNMAGILVTLASLLFASTLLSASGLGFLGVGVQPPAPEWGTMLGESRAYIRTHAFLATFPGLFLACSALGFNLLGEALRTIYDPIAAKTARRPRRPDLPRRAIDDLAIAVPGPAGGAALTASRLEVSYFGEKGAIAAVRGVDLTMRPGRTLAVVGESGSGKSTLLRALATLLPQGRAGVTDGRIFIGDRDLARLSDAAIRDLRRRDIGIVFQDAASALNPVMTIGEQLIEAINAGTSVPRAEAQRLAIQLLTDVQISDPQQRLDAYPHQFSGGMKQRIVIAIALAQSPRILLADEPTSALDVTIQQQILTLLREMQHRRGMAMLLVTHDLGLVARYADDVAVMYAGRIVETGPVEEVLGNPRHPYTRALRLSSPRLRNTSGSRYLPAIAGEPPLVGAIPAGCSFAPRCERRAGFERCMTDDPGLRQLAGSAAACHRAEEPV
ncbi:dipeptide/oligopeptide/nickel ABC transporter permease/ATP-binding protein [Bosea sp. PAMC 26642]|uniref:dipeptide/oligopeptide/nickel ABC transporter permease/ATP-binding protein n=1 Tax=Bosea sp. (strain PAMC 26642) TaxID=1792307 RepID=UPI00076FF563|nr:dipeptide/oligopeptide/nickel ABC transporter permease/ATP-binding protein [Bosea sp. PAMC 26642]AMJ61587.1 hypothetical protein AXW83_15885 [Bosea sp. PAMC 26642]